MIASLMRSHTLPTDDSLLYALPRVTEFDGTENAQINTGLVLFPQERDLSILLTMSQDVGAGSFGKYVFRAGTFSSPWRGFGMQFRVNWGSSQQTGYVMATENGDPGYGAMCPSFREGVINRYVVRHQKGHYTELYNYNESGGYSAAQTAQNAVVCNAPLWIGGNSSSANIFTGIIYDFRVFARYLSDEERNAYLGYTPN